MFAYQEGPDPPNVNGSVWKRVGDVKALPLPMACTLTQVIYKDFDNMFWNSSKKANILVSLFSFSRVIVITSPYEPWTFMVAQDILVNQEPYFCLKVYFLESNYNEQFSFGRSFPFLRLLTIFFWRFVANLTKYCLITWRFVIFQFTRFFV